jgi:DHA1 family multidrug resistance protein-like MFS transporter
MNIKKAFWMFSILAILSMISDRIIFVILPYYLLDKGISGLNFGLVFSMAAALVIILPRIFIGKLSDLIGRKKIYSLGLLIEAVSTSFYPFLSSIYEFGINKGVKDFSDTVEDSVEDAIMADTFNKKIRAKYIAKIGTFIPFGRAIATVIGFLIVTYFSLTLGFYVASAVVFIEFLVFTFIFKEPVKKIKKTFKLSIKDYPTKFKIITIIGFFIAINFGMSYYPAFFELARSLGITESALFALLFFDYIISSIFTWKSKDWIDKIGRTKTVVITTLGFSIFSMLYAFSSNIIQFFLVLVGISISFYIYRVAFKTILMDSTIAKIRGEQIGFGKTLQGVGDIIGPVLGGFLIDFVSLPSAFIFSGIFGLIAIFLAWTIR